MNIAACILQVRQITSASPNWGECMAGQQLWRQTLKGTQEGHGRGQRTRRVGRKEGNTNGQVVSCYLGGIISYLRLGIDFPLVSWLPSVSSVSGSSTVAYFFEESTFEGAVAFRPGLDEHIFYVVSHFQDFHNEFNDIPPITAEILPC